jgi:ferritin-like metal-binding protein YciE
MAKEPKQFAELIHDTLQDIYYAEKKILAALPAAFQKHEVETEEQVSRLNRALNYSSASSEQAPNQVAAAPTVSAITAPLAPSGFSPPIVESIEV